MIDTMTTRAHYDINVWSEAGKVYLTFYPLRYPDEDNYPNKVTEDSLPVMDTSVFFTLGIPADARGPRYRNALSYLETLVNEDHRLMPEIYPAPEWTTGDDMDWWNTELCLTNPPQLIAEFMAVLPRKEQ